MVYDDPTTDPRGVALSHEGVLAAVLLDGVTTSSYSDLPRVSRTALLLGLRPLTVAVGLR
jgi:hypothetical protein